jgi:hypothetical protein
MREMLLAHPSESLATARLARAEQAYAHLRLLSADVALAALAGGVMAVRVIGASPRPAFYLLLPLSVWVVYTLDHLLDARRVGPAASTPRHRFHFRHAKTLWIFCAVAAIVCGVIGLAELSWPGIGFGFIIAGMFGLHELLVKLAGDRASPLLMKELGVAVIFTAGTWGLPLLQHLRVHPNGALRWPVTLMAQYFLLALVNLIEFSMFEAKTDALDGHTSFVRGVGRARARHAAWTALILQLPLMLIALFRHPAATTLTAELIYTAMATGLMLILLFPRTFARSERFRTLGDGVFLLPLVMAVV